jgi:hypothetical protein
MLLLLELRVLGKRKGVVLVMVARGAHAEWVLWKGGPGGQESHLLPEPLLAEEQAVALLLDDAAQLLQSAHLPAITPEIKGSVP